MLRVVQMIADDLPGLLRVAEGAPFHACAVTERLDVIAGLLRVFPDVGGMKAKIERLKQALDGAFAASQADGAPDKMDLAEALKRAEDPAAVAAT